MQFQSEGKSLRFKTGKVLKLRRSKAGIKYKKGETAINPLVANGVFQRNSFDSMSNSGTAHNTQKQNVDLAICENRMKNGRFRPNSATKMIHSFDCLRKTREIESVVIGIAVPLFLV